MKQRIALLLALLLCLSFAACGRTQEDETTTEAPTQTTLTTTAPTTETTTLPTTEAAKDWNVTPVKTPLMDTGTGASVGQPINGRLVKWSNTGKLRLFDETTEQETVICKDHAWTYAFDGETVLYTLIREDPTVDFDKSYRGGDGLQDIKVYEVDDVVKYDVATGTTEKLFSKYCSGGGFLYFDDSAVLYEDIDKSQIGYRNGYDPYMLCLYRYDLKTGERTVVLKDTFAAFFTYDDGKPYIVLNDEKTKAYDIMQQQEVAFDYQDDPPAVDDAYDACFVIDGVVVTWTLLDHDTCEIAYYDDDGTRVVFDTVKSELPEQQDAFGYYVSTDDYDEESGEMIYRFIPYSLDFLK